MIPALIKRRTFYLKFDLKFDLPGGRAGMKPQVGIGYNSNGGSDECGKGFSIQGLSSITIDTRWGLPKYDGDDLYLLDGEKLKKVESEENDENITYYETEAKKNYEEIKKINEDGKIYWEIRSKDGRKRTYGGYDLKAKNENIYKYEFKITKEEDLRGNEIIYEFLDVAFEDENLREFVNEKTITMEYINDVPEVVLQVFLGNTIDIITIPKEYYNKINKDFALFNLNASEGLTISCEIS